MRVCLIRSPVQNRELSERKSFSKHSLSFRGHFAAIESIMTKMIHQFGKLTEYDPSLSVHPPCCDHLDALFLVTPYDSPHLSGAETSGSRLDCVSVARSKNSAPVLATILALFGIGYTVSPASCASRTLVLSSAPATPRSMHLDLTRLRMLTERLCVILCLIRSTTRVSLRPCSFSSCRWLWARTRRESASRFGEHWPATS
jgi:hypothetical protein